MACRQLLLLVVTAVSLCVISATDPTLVTLPEGQIRGHTLRSSNDHAYYAFQEIPFAAPPVGKLRFQPPVPPQRWNGVLDTTKNTKICYQSADSFEIPGVTQTEDCLYLNVYTPVKPGHPSPSPLPILLFIHGGGYAYGASIFQVFKPGPFMDYNVITVTMNYRLGPLGFLTTEDGVIPANVGLRDISSAIQWVKKNIHLFGGDPGKITVSGESSGAAAATLQFVTNRNRGLFRAAILQSGSGIAQWTRQDYARYYAFKLGKSLDSQFRSEDSNELLKLLQRLPATTVNNNTITVEVGKESSIIAGEGYVWVPVIEKDCLEGTFLTGSIYEKIRTGDIMKIPILIGVNSEEELLPALFESTYVQNRAKYFDSDLSNLIRNRFKMTPENKVKAGRELRQIYTKGTFQEDPGTVIKFSSDALFTSSSTRHAKLQSKYADVYMYQFSYKGKMGGLLNASVAGVGGVAHAEELGYLWDAPIGTIQTPYDPKDLAVRHRLLKMWSNFVKCLNPTPERDASLGNIRWEKLTQNNLAYLDINSTLEMKKNPRNYLQWEKITDKYAIPPLANY